MNYNKEKIEIRVKGPAEDQEIVIFLPWSAKLDDWTTAFKCIMIHQTFTEDQIKNLFFNEDFHEYKEKNLE